MIILYSAFDFMKCGCDWLKMILFSVSKIDIKSLTSIYFSDKFWNNVVNMALSMVDNTAPQYDLTGRI